MPEIVKEHLKTRMKEDAQNAAKQANEIPAVMAHEADSLKGIKKLWGYFRDTDFYKKFRSSQLNPYHFAVEEIEADNLNEARKIAREKAKAARAKGEKHRAEFIYNGTRYYADKYDCTPQEEYRQDGIVIRDGFDITDRIPRNEKNEFDLFAETPIVIAINPIEGPALIGHACMQYKDQVINRLLPSIHTDPLYPKYNKYAEYFFIYPDQLKIDGKELYREMEKHNIRYGDKRYDPLFNNCAQNVAEVLKKVGVKDFNFYGPDSLGLSYATPGNNPFGIGLKAWCHKHGLRVTPNEMEEYDRLYGFTDVKERRTEMKEIRGRYRKSIGKGNDGR